VVIDDLLDDIVRSAQPDYRLVLATKTIKGALIQDAGVQVRDVGCVEFDESESILRFVPGYMSGEQGNIQVKTAQDLRNAIKSASVSYQLLGVDRRKERPDGSMASLTVPVVGTYIDTEDKEIWLLQAPIEQWE
jgi:hypothetical protein